MTSIREEGLILSAEKISRMGRMKGKAARIGGSAVVRSASQFARLRLLAAPLLLLGSLAPLRAQTVPAMPAPQPGYVFPARQTLTYSVDWRVFTAGTATFHLESQGEQEKVSVTADSVGAVNMLYPVVDRFQSAFDQRTGCASFFNKQLQEGRRKISSELRFDYAQSKQFLTEKNLVQNTTRQQQGPISGCVTDVLSAIFYASSQKIAVGQNFQLPVADVIRMVTVTMKPEDHEEVKTPAGTFETIRVQPTADAGVVKNRGNIWIWYTDDARHIPVQMRARLFFGTITFHLQSMESK